MNAKELIRQATELPWHISHLYDLCSALTISSASRYSYCCDTHIFQWVVKKKTHFGQKSEIHLGSLGKVAGIVQLRSVLPKCQRIRKFRLTAAHGFWDSQSKKI